MKVITILLVFFLISCGSQKIIVTEKRDYMWEDKMVTKKEFDSLLYHFTFNYVKSNPIDTFVLSNTKFEYNK